MSLKERIPRHQESCGIVRFHNFIVSNHRTVNILYFEALKFYRVKLCPAVEDVKSDVKSPMSNY
jgi:hypothetical protein